jgi:dTDP-4-amino-4,6-dideoxygalactose transaminase
MHVPLLDIRLQYQSLRAEIHAAIERVCDAQAFILGPEVRALEAEVATYSGCKFGVGVSSGTDALLVALMALDIGPGDEVITSPYTFFATGGTIARVGARPVFVDIDPVTFNISSHRVFEFLTQECELRGTRLTHKRTGGWVKAMMPVHLYGQTAEMDVLTMVARQFELKIIEDAAQSIGARDNHGHPAGSLGDIGCLSFFPSKNLGAFGDAGMCVTNDAVLAKRLAVLRVHGGEPKYYHQVIGGNFRLDELQAAVLRVKLPHLDAWTAARQRNAKFYDAAFAAAGLGELLVTPVASKRKHARHIYNQYIVRAARRDELKAHLARHEIGTEIYYPVPLHRQQCFEYLGYTASDCPESVRAAAETLALPIYPELTEAQLHFVVDTIVQFYR